MVRPQRNVENHDDAKFGLNRGCMMTHACPRCDAVLRPSARFFVACGAALDRPGRLQPQKLLSGRGNAGPAGGRRCTDLHRRTAGPSF